MKAEEYFEKSPIGRHHRVFNNQGFKVAYAKEDLIKFAKSYAKHVLKEDKKYREVTGRY